jgi:hypothetical protein
MNRPTYNRIIGIDGGTKTGLADWNPHQKRFMRIATLDFWSAFFEVCETDASETLLVIEDPQANRPVFHRAGVTDRRAMKVAQNVGAVKRESRLLAEGFERAGYRVVLVRPGGRKWDAATFRALTRHVGRTSQHGRDAAKLVFGLSAYGT